MLVNHEIETDLLTTVSTYGLPWHMPSLTYVRSNTSDSGNYASVESRESALGPVHLDQSFPHAGHFAWPLAKLRKRRGLDRQPRANDVERVGEGH